MGVRKHNVADSLFKAVTTCQFNTVRFLLNNGVSANAIDGNKQNLLILALHIEDENKRDIMFRYLLKRGVNGCYKESLTGRDVLTWASYLGRTQQVQTLLEETVGEINPSSRDKQGMTALHHAAIQGQLEIARLLINIINKYHLSSDMADKKGLTPYIYAKKLGFYAIADLLVTEGHCCAKQFDSLLHRSVDEWINIGAQERKDHVKNQRREILEKYKIRGKISSSVIQKDPAGIARLHLPAISLFKCDPLPSPKKNVLHHTKVQMTPRTSTVLCENPGHPRSNISCLGTELRPSKKHVHENHYQLMENHDHSSRRPEAVHQRRDGIINGASRQQNLPFSRQIYGEPGQSPDMALTLLGMQHSTEFTHNTQFFRSELDPSKKPEAGGVVGEIPSIMAIVSQQQSASFRATTKTATSPTLPRKLGAKNKGSTLAVLFSRRSKLQSKQRSLGYDRGRNKQNG